MYTPAPYFPSNCEQIEMHLYHFTIIKFETNIESYSRSRSTTRQKKQRDKQIRTSEQTNKQIVRWWNSNCHFDWMSRLHTHKIVKFELRELIIHEALSGLYMCTECAQLNVVQCIHNNTHPSAIYDLSPAKLSTIAINWKQADTHTNNTPQQLWFAIYIWFFWKGHVL